MSREEIVNYIKENNGLDILLKESSKETVDKCTSLIDDGLIVSNGHIGNGYFELKPTEKLTDSRCKNSLRI